MLGGLETFNLTTSMQSQDVRQTTGYNLQRSSGLLTGPVASLPLLYHSTTRSGLPYQPSLISHNLGPPYAGNYLSGPPGPPDPTEVPKQ